MVLGKMETGQILFVSGLLLNYQVKKQFKKKNISNLKTKLCQLSIIPCGFLALLSNSGLNEVEVEREITEIIQFHIFYLPSLGIIYYTYKSA